MLDRLLEGVCAYEAIALRCRRWPRLSRHIPPITRIVHGCRNRPLPTFLVSVAAVVLFLFSLAYHLLIDNWEDQ